MATVSRPNRVNRFDPGDPPPVKARPVPQPPAPAPAAMAGTSRVQINREQPAISFPPGTRVIYQLGGSVSDRPFSGTIRVEPNADNTIVVEPQTPQPVDLAVSDYQAIVNVTLLGGEVGSATCSLRYFVAEGNGPEVDGGEVHIPVTLFLPRRLGRETELE
jgi:hypothetical protein